MLRVFKWFLFIALFCPPVFSQCDLAPLSSSLQDGREKPLVIFDEFFLYELKYTKLPISEKGARHHRLRISLLKNGSLTIELIQETQGVTLVGVPQGTLVISPAPNGSKVLRLSFYDVHAGLWNRRKDPTWTYADQSQFTQVSQYAWKKIQSLLPLIKDRTGFDLFLEDRVNQEDEFWPEVPSSLPFVLRVQLNKYLGTFTLSVLERQSDQELALVRVDPRWRGPAILNEFEAALKKQGLSEQDLRVLMPIVSQAVRIFP